MYMAEIKYTEEVFRQLLEDKYGDSYKIVGRYKGYQQPLLLQNKYGLVKVKQAKQAILWTPDIKAALNKTEYFMAILKEEQPQIHSQLLAPLSEYITAKTPMLFDTEFGVVSLTPDNLLAGHGPTMRAAVNRKDYYKRQLLKLYEGFGYDFIVTSTSRHEGKVTLVCPIHGEQLVDTDGIFLGKGCPACNSTNKSDVLYFIRLYNDNESFYKIGISYYLGDTLRRYRDYEDLGYTIEELAVKKFDSNAEVRNKELEIKRLIKPFLYTPKNWPSKTSTECFQNCLLENIHNLISQDIVSTSTETQSSLNKAGEE